MNLHPFDPPVQPARVPTLTEVLDAVTPSAPPTPAEPLPVLVEPVETPGDGPAVVPLSWAAQDAAPALAADPQALADELARRLAPQLEALVDARLRAASAAVAQALLAHARRTLADDVHACVAAAVRDALTRPAAPADDPRAGL